MCIVKLRREPRFAPLSGANLGILYFQSEDGLSFFMRWCPVLARTLRKSGIPRKPLPGELLGIGKSRCAS